MDRNLGKFAFRGSEEMVEVKLLLPSGEFTTTVGETELTDPTLAGLLRQVSKTVEGHRINEPIVGLDGRRGVLRGFHASNHDALVTWEDGEKGRLSQHNYILPPESVSDDRIAEMRAAVKAQEQAQAAVREAGDRLKAANQDGQVRVGEFLAAAIGTDLFSRSWEPEDNDDEVAREIAEHERAIFDNPDPAYGP